MESEVKTKAMGLIDSEYEVLVDFNTNDLWDYLYGVFNTITRKESDELHKLFGLGE